MKIKVKKGLDLHLAGAVSTDETSKMQAVSVERCAIVPDDFTGLRPKPEVKPGDRVVAGQAVLRDKDAEGVKIVSPIAGVVEDVVRGDRRKIERVVIKIDRDSNDVADFSTMPTASAEDAVKLLCASGIMARMRQRPYDVVPVDPLRAPRDIFVTAIDTNPLAVPMSAYLGNDASEMLSKAAALLGKVTKGKVYFSIDSTWVHGEVKNAEMVTVEGPHPSGNVGVQIANIAPVNKGEVVWTLDAVTLYKLGKILATGRYDGTTAVALTGSEVKHPCLLSTIEGAEIAALVAGRLNDSEHHVRIISGNVLTGTAVGKDGYLHYPYRQITVIPEGDDVDEFMGWASLSPRKMSTSRSFPGHFLNRLFSPDARMLGGRRAMIMSGEYDKVLPMDIMAEYLLKAIISRDINAMEQLGIYEVAPEDFALCEYVDTSKIPLQQIVREGLDYLRNEVG